MSDFVRSATRCTQQFCWCTQQFVGKDLKAPQEFLKKITLASLSPPPASSSFLGRFCFCFCFFFCFFILLLLFRDSASSSFFFFFAPRFCIFFPSEGFFFIFVAAIVARIRRKASSSRFCFFFEVRFSFTFLLLPSLLPAMAETAIGNLLGCLRINLIHKRLTNQVIRKLFVSSLRINLIRKSLMNQLDP